MLLIASSRRRVVTTTMLVIDEKLLEEARLASMHQTEEEVITEALQEYIARRKQRQILDLFGTIEYDADYDYKSQRRRQ